MPSTVPILAEMITLEHAGSVNEQTGPSMRSVVTDPVVLTFVTIQDTMPWVWRA